jgi:carboxymethylenebutenolidase
MRVTGERSAMTQRTDVEVPTPEGMCPSVMITPEGEGPWPAVIMFMDAGGVRPAMVDMAEHLAGMGFVTLLPEMYYRHGKYAPFDAATAFTDPDERSRMMTMARSLTQVAVASDAGAFLEFLSGRPEVAGTMTGTTGYCLGGRLSLIAAGYHPDRIVAAASFHGGHLAGDSPESPHHVVDRIRGRVYVAAAADDATFPPEQAALLENVLSEAGVEHVIEVYPAHHGFAVSDNPTYDAAAATRHWQALADLFGTMLST